jgi:SAM-dependent methyltransferase
MSVDRVGPADGILEVPRQRRDSFTDVFTAALRGRPTQVVHADGSVRDLPVHRWQRMADEADRELLAHCRGATIDVGCGPGRMSAHLAVLGVPVLGVDVVHEAVAQTRGRGVPVLRRDVFAPLPGEGRWGTVLLADGNIGIGGDPLALLRRAAELVHPGGRVVVDLDPPGTGWTTQWCRLRCDGAESSPFRWAKVGMDAVPELAARAGLEVWHATGGAGRWYAVLGRP